MIFEEMVAKISPVLRRIVARLSSQYVYFSSDDLYQEAQLHLWLDFQEGKLQGKTDSYILQGCYFYLKNFIRKYSEKAHTLRLGALVNEEGEGGELDRILSLDSGEPVFENLHCQMVVEQIMNNGLTPREKEVFALSMQGLTIREIGERIGVSHVMVLKLKNAMRQKCLKHLDPV